MAWAKNGTPDTLGSAVDNAEITDLTDFDFGIALFHQTGLSANNDTRVEFNSDTSTNYSDRFERNGGAENTSTSLSGFRVISSNGTFSGFTIGYWVNIPSEEKLAIIHSIQDGGTGASNDPDRDLGVGKWANTADGITAVKYVTTAGATMSTNTNLSVLGDVTEEAILGNNVQSGSRFEATDTRKIYYWNGTSWTEEV